MYFIELMNDFDFNCMSIVIRRAGYPDRNVIGTVWLPQGCGWDPRFSCGLRKLENLSWIIQRGKMPQLFYLFFCVIIKHTLHKAITSARNYLSHLALLARRLLTDCNSFRLSVEGLVKKLEFNCFFRHYANNKRL